MNQLTGNELKPAEYMRNVFAVTVPPSVTPEKLLESSFWTHVSAKLHPTDRVEVTVESGEWLVVLFVASCGRNWAKMIVLDSYDLTGGGEPVKETAESAFYWAYRGQNLKHCAMRKSDKSPVKEGFDSRDEVLKWIAEHEKTLQAK